MSHLTTFNQNDYEPKFQNAYEYLDNVKLEIRGLPSAIELEIHDIVCCRNFRTYKYTFNKNWRMLLTS
ncbi:hypothetical protein BH18THE1_BH18THE1_00330 [soil metagenome]